MALNLAVTALVPLQKRGLARFYRREAARAVEFLVEERGQHIIVQGDEGVSVTGDRMFLVRVPGGDTVRGVSLCSGHVEQ
jgi:hypothetical protein